MSLKRGVFVTMWVHGTDCDEDRRDWRRWSPLTCRESSASALRVGWRSLTGCFRWSARSCGRPLRERSRRWLALVGSFFNAGRSSLAPHMSDTVESTDCLALQMSVFNTLPLSRARPNAVGDGQTADRSKIGTRSKTALWRFPRHSPSPPSRGECCLGIEECGKADVATGACSAGSWRR
jgi:hypothetical protein